MQIDLMAQPASAAAKITLESGESITAETGAMIAMSKGLTVETTSRQRGGKGGIMKGLKRMFSGESFFLNHFTAEEDHQELLIGPSLIGDVVQHELNGTMVVQGSSWLASANDIQVDTTWQGFGNAILSGEGLFWVKCSGNGPLLLNSFGAVYPIDVDGDYVVDTGHIVAFEDSLSFKIGKSNKSWLGSFFGGEGLVCRFSGQGRLYCQTHNPPDFGSTLGPKLRPR